MPRGERTTVGELIVALRGLPADMRVVVAGADGVGLDDVTTVVGVDACIDVNPRSSFGRHEPVEDVAERVRDKYKRETVAVLRHG